MKKYFLALFLLSFFFTHAEDINMQVQSLVPGSVYEHYKGMRYKILGIGHHSESEEEMVIYQALYGPGEIWVRPLSMFLENVTIKGETKPRFRKVAMEYVPQTSSVKKVNSSMCTVYEYPMQNKQMDICVAEIKGRYPDSGFAINHKCSEMGYIVGGSGRLVTENEEVELSCGDAVYIPYGEKYYWEGDFSVALTSNPPWHFEQHEITR